MLYKKKIVSILKHKRERERKPINKKERKKRRSNASFEFYLSEFSFVHD
jgi:hypothetical protein